MRGFWTLFKMDFKLYMREPAAAFFTVMFPVLLVVVGGYSFGTEVVFTTASGLEVRILDVMLPAVLVMIMASQGLMGVYPVLTSLREGGALKYYRTHPIRPWHMLASQFLVGLVTLLLALGLLLGVAHVLFGLRYEGHLPLLLLAGAVTYAAFFAMGFGLAGVTSTARSAQALGSLIFFPMLFLSGSFGPRESLPPVLKFLSDLSPMTFATDLLTDLWFAGSASWQEAWRLPLHSFQGTELGGQVWFAQVQVGHGMLYLTALTLVFGLLAVFTFRWGEEGRSAPRAGGRVSVAGVDGGDVVLRVEGLVKTYGDVRAVDGLSFAVKRGEIFGLLGPNGAGKTTTLECIEGLRRPDAGEIRLLGLHPQADYDRLVHRIGVQLQQASLPARLKVREALDLFAAFYKRTLPPDVLLERLDLASQAESFVGQLSGGQKQRLFAALALLNAPEVVFLDEITTGLDAHIRREVWTFLQDLRRQGKTVVLTSHYLEEAQALCDRVLVLDQGRKVVEGRPLDLIRDLGWGVRVEMEWEEPAPGGEVLQRLPGVRFLQRQNGVWSIGLASLEDVESLLAALRRHGLRYRRLNVRSASLEDVFLALTGNRRAPETEDVPA